LGRVYRNQQMWREAMEATGRTRKKSTGKCLWLLADGNVVGGLKRPFARREKLWGGKKSKGELRMKLPKGHPQGEEVKKRRMAPLFMRIRWGNLFKGFKRSGKNPEKEEKSNVERGSTGRKGSKRWPAHLGVSWKRVNLDGRGALAIPMQEGGEEALKGEVGKKPLGLGRGK